MCLLAWRAVMMMMMTMPRLEHNCNFTIICSAINFMKIAIFRIARNFRNFRKIRNSRWAFSATNLANSHLVTNFTKLAIFRNSWNFRKIRSSCWALLENFIRDPFSALQIFTVFVNFAEGFNPGLLEKHPRIRKMVCLRESKVARGQRCPLRKPQSLSHLLEQLGLCLSSMLITMIANTKICLTQHWGEGRTPHICRSVNCDREPN